MKRSGVRIAATPSGSAEDGMVRRRKKRERWPEAIKFGFKLITGEDWTPSVASERKNKKN